MAEIELTEAELDLVDNNVDEPTLTAFVRAFVKDVIDDGGCGEDEGYVLIVPPTGEIKLYTAHYETRLVEDTDDFSVDMGATLEPFFGADDQPQPETEKAT
jgi:hypothetical protein